MGWARTPPEAGAEGVATTMDRDRLLVKPSPGRNSGSMRDQSVARFASRIRGALAAPAGRQRSRDEQTRTCSKKVISRIARRRREKGQVERASEESSMKRRSATQKWEPGGYKLRPSLGTYFGTDGKHESEVHGAATNHGQSHSASCGVEDRVRSQSRPEYPWRQISSPHRAAPGGVGYGLGTSF